MSADRKEQLVLPGLGRSGKERIAVSDAVHDQSWIFIGRTDAEAEVPILGPPNAKSRQLTRKDPDAGKDWGQEETRATEDEMAGWHHWLNGHEFGWTPEAGDGQGGPACCGPWVPTESDSVDSNDWAKAAAVEPSRCLRRCCPEESSPRGRFTSKWSNKLML